MKKHDEGYVLAYVTVVLLLFCLIATGILTGAMKNMTNQQDTIQRMKDRYAAEGIIQQVISRWTTFVWSNYSEENNVVIPGVLYLGEEELDIDGTKVSVIILSASSGEVEITCKIGRNDGKYKTFDIGVPATVPTGEGEP